MKTKDNKFSRRMMRWYHAASRPLPWRETQDPYKIWISEVMLQQTTVQTVIPYYEKWVKQFPDIQSVSRSPVELIIKYWQGLGYYSRARNIHKTAQIISVEHGGVFPSTKDELRRLPGFGPYTTGAVLSIAFDKREPIIDANVRRVVMRQLKLKGKADTRHDEKILEFLLSVMPQKNNRIFNQSLMELGALICKSKNPSCLACPVKDDCLAFEDGVVDIIPEPKKITIKNIKVAVACILSGDKFFMQKRPAGGLFADLWEFPGGKIEKGETPQQALVREVKEETGIEIEVVKKVANITQFYTQFKADLHVWLCRPLNMPKVDSHHKWLKLKDLHKYPMPSGTVKMIPFLEKL